MSPWRIKSLLVKNHRSDDINPKHFMLSIIYEIVSTCLLKIGILSRSFKVTTSVLLLCNTSKNRYILVFVYTINSLIVTNSKPCLLHSGQVSFCLNTRQPERLFAVSAPPGLLPDPFIPIL